MRQADGRETILRFELPLSITLVTELSQVVDAKLTELGYTDVSVNTTNGWQIIATPPARGAEE